MQRSKLFMKLGPSLSHTAVSANYQTNSSFTSIVPELVVG